MSQCGMGIDFDSESANAFLGLDAIGLSAQCEANTDRSLAHAPRPRKQNCCAHDPAKHREQLKLGV